MPQTDLTGNFVQGMHNECNGRQAGRARERGRERERERERVGGGSQRASSSSSMCHEEPGPVLGK